MPINNQNGLKGNFYITKQQYVKLISSKRRTNWTDLPDYSNDGVVYSVEIDGEMVIFKEKGGE